MLGMEVPGAVALSKTLQTKYPAFLAGNEPKIPDALPSTRGAFYFVGTSGLGALALALRMNTSASPCRGIIIIDNSANVLALWRHLKTWTKDDLSYVDLNDFDGIAIAELMDDRLAASAQFFVMSLADKYDAKLVLEIIRNAIVIPQSWGDAVTLTAVSNYVVNEGCQLVAYTSNILGCVARNEGQAAAEKMAGVICNSLTPDMHCGTTLVKKSAGYGPGEWRFTALPNSCDLVKSLGLGKVPFIGAGAAAPAGPALAFAPSSDSHREDKASSVAETACVATAEA